MLFFFIPLIVLILCPLLSVAFFTLLERKLLSLSQTRMGPNKLSLAGILQPVLDGLKLLSKSSTPLVYSSRIMFYFVPMLFFVLMLLLWMVCSIPGAFAQHLPSLFLLAVLGLSSYVVMISGIVSQSKFATLGAMRGAAQGLSYEVVFSLLLFSLVIFRGGWGLQNFSWGPWAFFIPIAFVCIVAESNRAPFDFAEGESELISGFNIEYGAGGFTLLFLGEYGAILAVSVAISAVFLSPLVGGFLFSFLVLLIRSVFPRFRYDALMGGCWYFLVPLTAFFLLYSFAFSF